MSYKSLISLIAACALLAATALPAGVAVAQKKSGGDLEGSASCSVSLGAFPSAESDDDSDGGKPSGQIGKKPSPGQKKNNDDDCEVGALPEQEVDEG